MKTRRDQLQQLEGSVKELGIQLDEGQLQRQKVCISILANINIKGKPGKVK